MSEPQHGNTPPNPGDNQGSAAGSANGQSGITRADFDGLRDSMFSTMRKMISDGMAQITEQVAAAAQPPAPKPPKAAPKAPEAAPPAPDPQVNARLEALELENKFLTASAGLSLAPQQKLMLQRLFIAERPDDPVGWLTDQAKVFNSAQSQPPEGGHQAPSPPSQGAPAGSTNGQTPARILDRSKSEQLHDFAMNAPVPTDRYDVRNKKYYMELNRQTRGELADTQVYIGPPEDPNR